MDPKEFWIQVIHEGGAGSAEDLYISDDGTTHFRFHPDDTDAVHLALASL